MDSGVEALFTPLHIGSMTLKNRLLFPAIGGLVSKNDLADFLALRAKGGAGLIIIGGCLLQRNIPAELIPIHTDDCVPLLKKIAKKVHFYGAKIGAQVEHQGRQTHYNDSCVAPSPIPWSPNSRVPRELTIEEIHNMVEEFSDGVRRIRDAGLDMAEIHAAHGYLITQFLSARSNKRVDEYGGDAVKRARFLVEIIRRAREKVGDAFPIFCRLNAVDYLEEGASAEDSRLFAQLSEEAGASLISVSTGVYGYPYTIPSMYSERSLNVEYARQIKEDVKIPVSVAGRIDDVKMAAKIIMGGEADLVAMGRPLLADPELPNKSRRGEFDRIRPCLYCNHGCMALMESRSTISKCTVNPFLGIEVLKGDEVEKAKKNVVVIGGGVAGLEAARIASQRGHKVTLYEKENNLGGQWLLAAVPPSKDSLSRYLKWLINEVKLVGVNIKLNSIFSLHDLDAEATDTVILATGAIPTMPPVPGIEKATTAWEVLKGNYQVSDDVLIVGGNATGLEVADFLAAQGKRVTVIEMTDRFGTNMPPTIWWHMKRLLIKHGVKLTPFVKLKQINSNKCVIVETKNGEEKWSGFNDIILATGTCSCNELKSIIETTACELHIIGDAKRPRSGLEAIAEGARVGFCL